MSRGRIFILEQTVISKEIDMLVNALGVDNPEHTANVRRHRYMLAAKAIAHDSKRDKRKAFDYLVAHAAKVGIAIEPSGVVVEPPPPAVAPTPSRKKTAR